MSLVINTNTIANSVQRNLSANQANLSKSLARLSSGSKIVDPTDDAGGLAVSMKLSAAINRNVRAQQNVQNSISFLQTQDGAMSNVARILDRMSELKTMSLDVTKNSDDIANYDAEFTQLQGQLSNIKAEDFNGIGLFNANTNLTVYTTESGDATGEPAVTATRTGIFQSLGNITYDGSAGSTPGDGSYAVGTYNDQVDYTASVATATGLTYVKNTAADGTTQLGYINQAASYTFTAGNTFDQNVLAGNIIEISNVSSVYDAEAGVVKAQVFSASLTTHDGGDVVFDDNTNSFYLAAGDVTGPSLDYDPTGTTQAAAAVTTNAGEFIKLGDYPSLSDYTAFSSSDSYETGDIVSSNGALYVARGAVTSGGAVPTTGASWTELGSFAVSGADLLTTSNSLSDYSVADFLTFIQTTATARAQNGAETARLQSSLDLLKTNQGNLSAARSVLADVDIATESTALARNNILVQSSAAMLAQANASQNVALSLLA
jgi:flagellin-like hook-associated protein FlgL